MTQADKSPSPPTTGTPGACGRDAGSTVDTRQAHLPVTHWGPALCPQGPRGWETQRPHPLEAGPLACAAWSCFAKLVGGCGKGSGKCLGILDNPCTLTRAWGWLWSENRPFLSPNPHGEQRPHPPNPPDPEQTATAPSGLPHQDWWSQPPASWMEGPTWHSGLQAEASIHGATWMRRLPLRPGLPSLERALVFGGALDGAQGRALAGQCCLQWASRTGPTDPSSSISIPLWGRNVGGGCSGASCPRPHARLGCQ